MESIRRYVNAGGHDVELAGHGGFVHIGIVNRRVVDGEVVSIHDDGGGWVLDYFDGPPSYAYRYRPGCECGWRGDVFWALKSKWEDVIIYVEKPDRGILPSDCRDELMSEWEAHTDTVIGVLVELDPISETLRRVEAAQDDLRVLDAELRQRVEHARRGGHAWSTIAERLGVSRQSAWERYKPAPDDTQTGS